MHLKSFIAPTATEAMAQIRAELGEHAIIVATRAEDGGGIRVTAAIEETRDVAAGQPRTAEGPAEALPGTLATHEDSVDIVYRAFRRQGLPALIGEILLEAVAGFETRDPVAALAAALRQTFRFAPTQADAKDPLFMVGLPGAGKTQTVAKLAARALVAGKRVAVMTADTERTGGAATLAAFAQGLKLDLVKIETPERLSEALAGVRTTDLVLIDGPGRNHLEIADMVALGRFLVLGGTEPLLVMPAGLDPVEAADTALAYKDLGVRRMVATRLDTARRLGGVLSAAYAAKLALAELSTTPRIKDGLVPFDPIALARLILTERRPAMERSADQDSTTANKRRVSGMGVK